jgi:hypothetical protein
VDTIKQGDTIPISGAMTIVEDGVDVTAAEDFSLWSAECHFRERGGAWSYDTNLALASDGTFVDEVPSNQTALVTAGATVEYDIRVRDGSDVVWSSVTRLLLVTRAVSGVPA